MAAGEVAIACQIPDKLVGEKRNDWCPAPVSNHHSGPWRIAFWTQGLWGPVVSPGASLQEALAAHCCREVIRDAVCTRCSLKATLSQLPDSAAAATSAATQRLQGLLRAGCPLPDCDFEALAAAAGLAWQERRAPLLKRALIARPPEVRARLGVSFMLTMSLVVHEDMLFDAYGNLGCDARSSLVVTPSVLCACLVRRCSACSCGGWCGATWGA